MLKPQDLIINTEILKSALKDKMSDKILLDQHIQRIVATIEAIDEKNWSTGKGYVAPRFPLFNKHIEGLESGLYIFAGESNSGKTGCMTNIFWDYVLNPDNNLYGIYFSLDDSVGEIYPRIVAMQQRIPIGCIKKPSSYQELSEMPEYAHYKTWLDKRAEGYEKLKEQANRMSVLDTTCEYCNDETEMYNFVQKFKSIVKEHDPNANIIIAIDAIDDIRLKVEVQDKAEEVAKIIKQWAITLDIPIFCTKHLKKLNGNRRPILDDLRDSNTLIYESSVVFLVFNDVSKNKGQAKIYYTEEGKEEIKLPIIELDWGKNKKSSYKGITFHHFVPDFSSVVECSEKVGQHYERSIYSI